MYSNIKNFVTSDFVKVVFMLPFVALLGFFVSLISPFMFSNLQIDNSPANILNCFQVGFCLIFYAIVFLKILDFVLSWRNRANLKG